ncbi:LysR family transcriptional regulator [Candidimonas nitroreducens]|nr:LysR family transcriptional regulator [Candidimonas nitroreducens]
MNNTKDLTAQHLRYLVALVSECHVTRAAEKMGIGQPAMSAALSRLRELFGDPLLIKTTSGLEPTPRAQELARRAQDAIELLSGAERMADTFDPATSSGHYQIMASEGVTAVLLPRLMELVRATAPNLRLTVGVGDILRASEFLRNGEVDLILGFVQKPAQDLYQAALYSQRLVCIASSAHPVIRGSLSFEQFIEATHVVWGAPPLSHPTLELMVDEALRRRGAYRKVALHLSSMRSSASIVARTDLLAVVPERIAMTTTGSLSLQTLPLPFEVSSVDVSMLWHERWHHAAAHAWLRAQLRDVGRTLQPGSVYD